MSRAATSLTDGQANPTKICASRLSLESLRGQEEAQGATRRSVVDGQVSSLH